MRSKIATWMLVGLLALGGVACQTEGGDEESSEEASAEETETVTETETETEGSETETEVTPATPATTAPAP